jgi:hypothetical protein
MNRLYERHFARAAFACTPPAERLLCLHHGCCPSTHVHRAAAGAGGGDGSDVTGDDAADGGDATGVPVALDLELLGGGELVVPWHTSDYTVDRLYTNEAACPK